MPSRAVKGFLISFWYSYIDYFNEKMRRAVEVSKRYVSSGVDWLGGVDADFFFQEQKNHIDIWWHYKWKFNLRALVEVEHRISLQVGCGS